VDAIVKAGISRVVVGAVDPNPRHAGRGLELLRAAGVAVENGVMADACTDLNRAFNHWITTGRPWVIAKAALSLDGRLSRPPGEGQWLTGSAERRDAMRLRARVDAIMVGAGTVRADNPQLTVRGIRGAATSRQPLRVVLSRSGRIPAECHLLSDAHRERTRIYKSKTLDAVLADLGRAGVTALLVEGGGELLGAFFDQKKVHEARIYLAPYLCGGPHVIAGRGAGASMESARITPVRYKKIGGSVVVSGPVFWESAAAGM
jgi:diaminohydroxyphosphoribosylaminopyrimidine deaminase/5-amino-6-(5-phosphoribosylamino)uracil reductase